MSIDDLLQSLYHPALKEIDPGLERVENFLHALGDPQLRIPPVIHVAGTNGKGSLIAYLHAIYNAAGLRVHRYISPHLVRFNERIIVAGHEIDNDTLGGYLQRIHALAQRIPVTFFEATTAAAFLAFADHPADITLLETGMGGRLDATNVIAAPLLTAITPVSLDHQEYLGNTLAEIAVEKAGILKPGVPCVVGAQAAEALGVIERIAQEKHTPLFRYGVEWETDTTLMPALPGAHQLQNASAAAQCAKLLGFTEHDTRKGIASAQWPARLQLLQEGFVEIWLDGGHNPGAGEVLGAWAAAYKDRPLRVICAMVKEKNTEGFLRPIAPYITELMALAIPGEPRSQSAEEIAAAARELGIETRIAFSIEEALRTAENRGKPCRILICGSLYLAGQILAMKEQGNAFTDHH